MRLILLDSPTSEYRQVAKRLRLLQRTYDDKLRNQTERREIHRRIAETLLNEAIFHQCPYSTCRAGFRRLLALGFSTMELMGHYYLLCAQVALQHGHRRTAYRLAKTMSQNLSKWLKSHRSLAGKQLLGLIRTFLQKSFQNRVAGSS